MARCVVEQSWSLAEVSKQMPLIRVVASGQEAECLPALGRVSLQARSSCEAAPLRHSMVVELGLDALLPGAALCDQGVAQAHLGAQLEDVGWRDPGLRQPALLQKLAQVAGVGAV
jgi:hypothetical protein